MVSRGNHGLVPASSLNKSRVIGKPAILRGNDNDTNDKSDERLECAKAEGGG